MMRFAVDRPLGVAAATVLDYRELARRRLPRQLFDYIDGGAYEEATMRANVADLERVLLRQIVMRDVSTRDQSSEVLGQQLAQPVILAPVGLAGMYARRKAPRSKPRALRMRPACHSSSRPSRSAASRRLLRQHRRRPGFSCTSCVIAATPRTSCHARRQSGLRVLVLTIDLAVVGARHRDTRNAVVGEPSSWAKIRRGLDLAGHPRWIADVALGGKPLTFGNLAKAVPGASSPADFKNWVDAQFDPSVTWDDVAWVRKSWGGRLLVKGVLDPEDARRAADVGVDGVVVSNHGGRQLDSVPSTAVALPGVVDAIGDQVEVLVDGGVRTGLDVVKMIALGARAVLIGRAWAWAVAAGGEASVRHMLDVLRSDIDTALGLTGQTSIADLDASALYRMGSPAEIAQWSKSAHGSPLS